MLIGLSGKMEVGKTTTAKAIGHYLEKKQFQNARIVSFATPLKEACQKLTGLPMEYFTDKKLKGAHVNMLTMSPRKLMQLLGTEFCRQLIGKRFWLRRMDMQLSYVRNTHNIIDDVRFDNEADYVRRNQGILIHLRRQTSPINAFSEHISERGLAIKTGDIIYELEEPKVDIINFMEKIYNGPCKSDSQNT